MICNYCKKDPGLKKGSDVVWSGFRDQMTGKTSQLNPRFVAEMMGFPANWMELPFQQGKDVES